MQHQLSLPRRGPRLSLARREALAGYLFVLPAVLGFFLWYAGPMVYSGWISLTDWPLFSDPSYLDLDTFHRLLYDLLYEMSLRVTFTFVVVSVPLVQVTGFAIALLLNLEVRGQAVFRTVYYLPTIAPLVASSVLWRWIFNSE